ncbi:MAG: hypothetical protein E7D27_16375, partial [Clostridium celatum]|nr:hypothetical protein [Clostridium celatum]
LITEKLFCQHLFSTFFVVFVNLDLPNFLGFSSVPQNMTYNIILIVICQQLILKLLSSFSSATYFILLFF